jgi:hypothetical protein
MEVFSNVSLYTFDVILRCSMSYYVRIASVLSLLRPSLQEGTVHHNTILFTLQ